MSIGTIITITSLILLGTGTLFSFAKFFDRKVARTYSRQDEIKEANKKEFVNKDICKVIHDQGRKDFDRLEKKVDYVSNTVTENFKEIVLLIKNGRNNA